jgi:hypothetical protein
VSLTILPTTVAGIALNNGKYDIRWNMLSEGGIELLEVAEEVGGGVP